VIKSVPIAVFASGGGSNFQALLDFENGSSYHIALLITDREQAGAIEKARKAGKCLHVLEPKNKSDQKMTAEILSVLEACEVKVVVLAGYLKKIPSDLVARYPRRIVNIHPALLPSYGGKGMYGRNVHEAVIQAGEKISGPTVHYVDENYDTGEVIAQTVVPVIDGDDPDSLADRVLQAEHQLYPTIVHQLCSSL